MRPQRGKQRLFDAAMTLFASHGYFATTVEQITEEAGVSKGLVYNYFKSKEELLVALIEQATARMAEVAGALSGGDSLEESLSDFVTRYLNLLKTERQFLKLQLTLMLMPELSEVVAEPQRQRAELLLSMVRDWFKRARVSSPKNKARLFLAMLDGVALHYLFVYETYPLGTMKPQLMRAARDACESPE
ncbi:MAG: AcrR family transcriptional regulator [Planctomycetota bacterium]|jgi:AcrR family transcriptional regulator